MTSAPYEHVVWVDDDLDHFTDVVDAAVGSFVKAQRLRLVCPNREAGLIASDIDSIGSLLSAAKH